MKSSTEETEVALSGAALPAIEHYPWHRAPWERLTRDLARLPHALLLHGQPGLGKRMLALRLAKRLLCERAQGTDDACGECAGCRLFAAGTHPDLLLAEPLEKSTQITVDQIRELGEFFALKPHQGRHKIVVIYPAQAMNINASNSLLKILEEPPAGSLLVLATHQPTRLSATIRSRCHALAVPKPGADEAVSWLSSAPRKIENAATVLAAAGGAPLLAAELAASGFVEMRAKLVGELLAVASGTLAVVSCAARWKALPGARVLAWLHGATVDLVRLATAGEGACEVSNPELNPLAKHILTSNKIKALYLFLDSVSEARNLAEGPLDTQLLFEDLLLRWSHVLRGSSTIPA